MLFVDEIDAITPRRETAGKEMERRIVSQLLACIDGVWASGAAGFCFPSHSIARMCRNCVSVRPVHVLCSLC